MGPQAHQDSGGNAKGIRRLAAYFKVGRNKPITRRIRPDGMQTYRTQMLAMSRKRRVPLRTQESLATKNNKRQQYESEII